MQLFILLLFWLTFGALTAQLARNKGRDPRLWFIIGVLLGVGGVIIALFVPKKEQKSTRSIHAPVAKIEEKPLLNEPSPLTIQQWYYLDPSHQQFGPVYLSTLKELYQEKHISEQTYIWTEGMENWKRLQEESSLINLIRPTA